MYCPRSVYRALELLRGGRADDRWRDGFADRLTHPVPSRQAVNRLIRERGMRPDLRERSSIPVVRFARCKPAGPGEVAVTWVGHATCVVQIGGRTILTDPVWSRWIPGVRPRLTPPGLAFGALPPIDAVVISHDHFDHLDAPTIRRLPRDVPVLVPAGLRWWFLRYGFTQVRELDWWDTTDVGGVRFTFTPAHHWSKRTLFDTCKSLWGGWMMTAGEDQRQVYFAGDSGYGPSFAEIGQRLPGTDVALLPVGAYLPRWFMKPYHMNPAEAVRACGDLGAERMVTIHWGAFVMSAETPMAPLRRAEKAWLAAGRDPEGFWGLAVGETRKLTAAEAVVPGGPEVGEAAGNPG